MSKPKKTYILVDCNNFYVSCERVFRPDLVKKPVAVLSNNDGCVVSRSQEVKDLGIKMGEPMFKIKEQVHRYQVQCFSSNYAMYADFSNRVISILKTVTSDIEIYSIDECFLKISSDKVLKELGKSIKETVFQWTGIPVSVGFGATKTQAKLANYMAKRAGSGIYEFKDVGCLDKISVSEVWGIGRRHAQSLERRYVTTVGQFMNKSEEWIKKYYHLPGLRTYKELRGQVCYDLESPSDRKTIISSRSFRAPIHKKEHLKGALADNVSKAAEKCRKQGSIAHSITLWVVTNRFKEGYYCGTWTGGVDGGSQDSRYLLEVVHDGLENCYRAGLSYVKTGVMLGGLESETTLQPSFWGRSPELEIEGQKVMSVMDRINRKWGKETLRLGSTVYDHRPWQMKQEQVSPRYTTSWEELREVVA